MVGTNVDTASAPSPSLYPLHLRLGSHGLSNHTCVRCQGVHLRLRHYALGYGFPLLQGPLPSQLIHRRLCMRQARTMAGSSGRHSPTSASASRPPASAAACDNAQELEESTAADAAAQAGHSSEASGTAEPPLGNQQQRRKSAQRRPAAAASRTELDNLLFVLRRVLQQREHGMGTVLAVVATQAATLALDAVSSVLPSKPRSSPCRLTSANRTARAVQLPLTPSANQLSAAQGVHQHAECSSITNASTSRQVAEYDAESSAPSGGVPFREAPVAAAANQSTASAASSGGLELLQSAGVPATGGDMANEEAACGAACPEAPLPSTLRSSEAAAALSLSDGAQPSGMQILALASAGGQDLAASAAHADQQPGVVQSSWRRPADPSTAAAAGSLAPAPTPACQEGPLVAPGSGMSDAAFGGVAAAPASSASSLSGKDQPSGAAAAANAELSAAAACDAGDSVKVAEAVTAEIASALHEALSMAEAVPAAGLVSAASAVMFGDSAASEMGADGVPSLDPASDALRSNAAHPAAGFAEQTASEGDTGLGADKPEVLVMSAEDLALYEALDALVADASSRTAAEQAAELAGDPSKAAPAPPTAADLGNDGDAVPRSGASEASGKAAAQRAQQQERRWNLYDDTPVSWQRSGLNSRNPPQQLPAQPPPVRRQPSQPDTSAGPPDNAPEQPVDTSYSWRTAFDQGSLDWLDTSYSWRTAYDQGSLDWLGSSTGSAQAADPSFGWTTPYDQGSLDWLAAASGWTTPYDQGSLDWLAAASGWTTPYDQGSLDWLDGSSAWTTPYDQGSLDWLDSSMSIPATTAAGSNLGATGRERIRSRTARDTDKDDNRLDVLMEWVDRRVEEIGEEWHDKINVESGRIMAVFPFPKVREGPAAGLMIRPPEIWYPPDPRMYGGGRPPSSGGGSSSGGGRGGAGGGGGSSGELSGESSGESSGVPSREGLVALSLALLVCGAAWWLIRTMLRAYENALVLAASPHPAPVFPSSLSGYGTRLAAGTLGKAAAGSTPPAGGSGNDRRHNAAK